MADNNHNTFYVFDIDGVITNPYTVIPNPQILAFIADQLSQRKPVMLATGRAVAWIEKHIIPTIFAGLSHSDDLELLFISGEKGGVTASYSKGLLETSIDPHLMLPLLLKEEIAKKIENYSGLFFDIEKQTMISIEMRPERDLVETKERKEELSEIGIWMKEKVSADLPDFFVDPTETAMDVQGKEVNKRLSARDFLIFLQAKKITPEIFLVFGDSPSDALLADELYNRGYAVSFGYVGKDIVDAKFSFPIFYPSDGRVYDEGMTELLFDK